jgi:hypothetical protein
MNYFEPPNPQTASRLFALPADIRLIIWSMLFQTWSIYRAGIRRPGYIEHARRRLCRSVAPRWKLLYTCRLAYNDCSPCLWSKAQVLYFDRSPTTQDFSHLLAGPSMLAGRHHVRSLRIVRAPRDWLSCDLWGVLSFRALQKLTLSQLLLCRVPADAEHHLRRHGWTETTRGKEGYLEDVADKLAMTVYNRSQMVRNDRHFFHLIETVFRTSSITCSQPFVKLHGKHDGKRVIEVGRIFMLRGHQRQSTRGR